MCLFTSPMNPVETGSDRVLTQTSRFFSLKCHLVRIRKTWFSLKSSLVFIKIRPPAASLPFKGEVTEQTSVKRSVSTLAQSVVIWLQLREFISTLRLETAVALDQLAQGRTRKEEFWYLTVVKRRHHANEFIDTGLFSLQESALLDKQEKWGSNLTVIFYWWIEGWLCNKDTPFWC